MAKPCAACKLCSWLAIMAVRRTLSATMQTILHVDMDAFFAAVEVMDHPEWAGKPVVVGSPPTRRGVVSTASYEARAFGIHSAMPSRTAGKLCPHAIFAPVRMSRYVDVSGRVMNILGSYTPLLEQVSVDEAFLDVAGVLRSGLSAEILAMDIRRRIRREVGLTASVGVAVNKYLAKLGSDLHKPDGLTVVPEGERFILEFLAPLAVGRIWGVGKVTEKLLRQAGYRTIGDLQQVPVSALTPVVGPALAEHIHGLAHGHDDRPVITESTAKSISAETTFDDDVTDPGVIRQELVGLVEQVGRRLRASGFVAVTCVIKIRLDDFQTMTRQVTLDHPVCSDSRLLGAAMGLLDRQRPSLPVRLVGFGVSGLSEAGASAPQLELFADPELEREARDERLDRVLDTLRDSIGEKAVTRASRLGPRGGHQD